MSRPGLIITLQVGEPPSANIPNNISDLYEQLTVDFVDCRRNRCYSLRIIM